MQEAPSDTKTGYKLIDMRALTNVQFTMSCLIRSPIVKVVSRKPIFKFKLLNLKKTSSVISIYYLMFCPQQVLNELICMVG